MTSKGSDVSAPFPLYKLDENIKQYNWNGEATDGSQETDERHKRRIQETDRSKDENQEEESTTDDTTLPAAPYDFMTADAQKLLNHFTYSDGVFKCITEVTSYDTFQ